MKTLVCLSFLAIPCFCLNAQCPKLIWSDEFNGTELNQNFWTYQIGDGCDINLCQWGNNELQWYTNSKDNLEVSNGTLKIKALKQSINNRNYTSARIRTLNKVDIKYGRIEARMKMPVGRGIWPAFWMMPTENVYGSWPQSGELDIMEYLGHEPNKVHGTLHFGRPAPNNSSTTSSFVKSLSKLQDDFHDYTIEWKENEIKWFVDGYLYSTKNPLDLNGNRWPFDQKFHFILNMAVGGNWPGNPNSSTVFPQTFEVDYIRVYDIVDGPYLAGKTEVDAGEKNVEFKLINLPKPQALSISFPGIDFKLKDSFTISANFTGKSGTLQIQSKECESYRFALDVLVRESLKPDIALENFDSLPRIKQGFASGTITGKVANPDKTGINTSTLSGKYVRSGSTLFDVLFYDINDVNDASAFVAGEKKFSIDLYTDAPVGTQVILQLENKNSATSSNYPTGRHSRYSLNTTKQNQWERLQFNFLDRPSTSVSDFTINQLVILFAPNTNNSSTYYFDNFEIYSRKETTAIPPKQIPPNINVYPNPIKDHLYIELKDQKKSLKAKLINNSGRVISEKILNQEFNIIKMHGLPAGLYVLNLWDETQSYFKKVIKF